MRGLLRNRRKGIHPHGISYENPTGTVLDVRFEEVRGEKDHPWTGTNPLYTVRGRLAPDRIESSPDQMQLTTMHSNLHHHTLKTYSRYWKLAPERPDFERFPDCESLNRQYGNKDFRFMSFGKGYAPADKASQIIASAELSYPKDFNISQKVEFDLFFYKDKATDKYTLAYIKERSGGNFEYTKELHELFSHAETHALRDVLGPVSNFVNSILNLFGSGIKPK